MSSDFSMLFHCQEREGRLGSAVFPLIEPAPFSSTVIQLLVTNCDECAFAYARAVLVSLRPLVPFR
jgi:hypothetical protein